MMERAGRGLTLLTMLSFVLAVALLAGSIMVQDPAVSGTGPVRSGDIVDLVPATLGGQPAEIEIVRGQEHVDGVDPEHADSITTLLTSVDASVEDVTSVSAIAFDGDLLSFVAGIQVAGADPQRLLEAYAELVSEGMAAPQQELGQIGGKTAMLLTDGSLGEVPLYIYGSGSIVWLLTAEEWVVAEVLGTLP